MEKVIIGSCELYHGDCREVLPTLARAHAIITDPPYEQEAHTNSRRLLGKSAANGARRVVTLPIGFDQMDDDLRRTVGKLISETCSGWSLVFSQVEGVHSWRAAISDGKYMRTAVWVKPDGAPQFTGDRPGMGYESIVIHWHGSGRSSWNGGGKHGVFVHSKSDAGYGHGGLLNEHPTKKPQKLMLELVHLFSNPGETVLDPFMGTGSTGVACVRSGRRFVGIEQNKAYFDAACRRIDEADRQPDLFIARSA